MYFRSSSLNNLDMSLGWEFFFFKSYQTKAKRPIFFLNLLWEEHCFSWVPVHRFSKQIEKTSQSNQRGAEGFVWIMVKWLSVFSSLVLFRNIVQVLNNSKCKKGRQCVLVFICLSQAKKKRQKHKNNGNNKKYLWTGMNYYCYFKEKHTIHFIGVIHHI